MTTPGQAAFEVAQARHSPQNRIEWAKLKPLSREHWEAEAQAAIDAATEGSLRACGYTLADVARFLEAESAAQGAQPAPDLSAGLADLESELRDVTRQVALCRSTKIPCVSCEQEITRAMGAVQRWAQDVAEHERTREPKAAPELAAAMAETRELRELVADIIDHPALARVTQALKRNWRKRAGLPS